MIHADSNYSYHSDVDELTDSRKNWNRDDNSAMLFGKPSWLARQLWSHMRRLQSHFGTAFKITYDILQDQTALSRDKIVELMNELETHGWLQLKRVGRAFLYMLTAKSWGDKVERFKLPGSVDIPTEPAQDKPDDSVDIPTEPTATDSSIRLNQDQLSRDIDRNNSETSHDQGVRAPLKEGNKIKIKPKKERKTPTGGNDIFVARKIEKWCQLDSRGDFIHQKLNPWVKERFAEGNASAMNQFAEWLDVEMSQRMVEGARYGYREHECKMKELNDVVKLWWNFCATQLKTA